MITRLKKPLAFFALAAALVWMSYAAAQKQAAQTSAATPSRIILTIAGDPARSYAVTWRTPTLAQNPQAQIAPLNPDPSFEKSAKKVPAKGEMVTPADAPAAAHYSVRFDDLKPGTKYCYRVGDGSVWSEWNVFQTASARPERFRFLYLGDAQNNIRSLCSRAFRTAFAAAPDARFMIHAGDLVADGYKDALWGEWSDAMGFITAMIPSLPVPGNHDLLPAPGTKDDNPVRAPDPWRWHFVLPENGPEGLRGQSYYVDYQGARFIALDVNIFAGKGDSAAAKKIAADQLQWLEKVLRDNPNRWTVVFQHQPPYPIARNRQADRIQSMVVPVFDKYNVDIVLAGHDHAYGRTHKLKGGKPVTAGQNGTIYAVSVSGPKMYNLTPDKALMAKVLDNSQIYQIITIDGGRLSYEAYTIDGVQFDKFELRKTGSR